MKGSLDPTPLLVPHSHLNQLIRGNEDLSLAEGLMDFVKAGWARGLWLCHQPGFSPIYELSSPKSES